jgi:hypothetical protein
MYTYMDYSINLFFTELGGFDFLALICGILIIISIIWALIRPFDF